MERLRRADEVLLDTYTSFIPPPGTVERIRELTGKEVRLCGRTELEEHGWLIEMSRNRLVCLLVPGDALSATTHNQVRMSAVRAGVDVEVLENASILNTWHGRLGLLSYKVGPPVSMPFTDERFFPPLSVADKVRRNLENGLHTLLLLDLDRNRENLDPHTALRTLLAMAQRRNYDNPNEGTMACVLSGLGQPWEKVVCGKISDLLQTEIGFRSR